MSMIKKGAYCFSILFQALMKLKNSSAFFVKKITVSTASFLVVLLLSFYCSASSQDSVVIDASDISYYTELYPPSNYLVDEKLVGISVETLKLMWRHMRVPEQPIQVVPWPRGYRIVNNTQGSMLFTMSRSRSRENLFKWVGPIYSSQHVMLARADLRHNIKTIRDTYSYMVAAIRNDISEVSLKSVGFPSEKMVPLTNLAQSILMLDNGRVDLIIVAKSSIKPALRELGLSIDAFQVVLIVNKIDNFYAFHIDTPDALIEQFQQALDDNHYEHGLLLDKYNLER